MKNKTGQQVRVGIFVTVGLCLAIFAIFLLGDVGGIFERQYSLYARFKDISGLRIGAPIYLAGINVGKVEGIRFPQKLEESKVVVSFQILHSFKDRVREDSAASIMTQGLLGDKAIFITVGSADFKELKNGQEIQVKESLSLSSFSEKGQELIDNINKLAGNINSVIDDIKDKDSIIHALIYDPEGEKIVGDLSKLVRSARSIVREIQAGRGVLHALIYDPARRGVGRDFSDAMENFQAMSNNLKKVSAKIEKGEGSIGGLINDPTVYYDLMTLLGNANRNKLLRTVIRATLATNEKDLTEN